MDLFELISNTDEFLIRSIGSNLLLTYFILFAIIFAESGIILFPYLPGDGLLFSVGVVTATTALDIYIVIPILILAAILGFLFNYRMGKFFGVWVSRKDNPYLRRSFKKTEVFIANYGQNAVIISRFFPIVRTYLPFIAGAVHMDFGVFLRQTVLGGVLWVCFFVLTGFFTGEIPWVKANYGLIFLGLVVLTLIPLFLQLFKTLTKRS